jgi:hypothetical protein
VIVVNQVLVLAGIEKVRVLWIDEKYTYAYVISLDDKTLPKKILLEEIYSDHELIDDPYSHLLDDSDATSKMLLARDKAWNIIEPLVSEEPEIYIKKQRGSLMKHVIDSKGVHQKVLYSYLKKYWQRGMTKNSLLGDYAKCGQAKVDGAKAGRKRQFADVEGEGTKITPEINKIFESVFKEHAKAANKLTMASSYRRMLAEYFKDNDAKPSYHQFIRKFKKFFSVEDSLKAKVGEKAFNKDNRPILSNSTKEAFGPGSKYQIDATVADVYLISEINRNWVIGRPVVYFCIDVFSRMIAGVYVGLEGPSMASARMAVLNCIADKVEFCARFGVDIKEEDWPVKHLPKAFLADNAEMKGVTAENMIQKFGIEIQTAGSYRADCKGIVERHFRTVHDYVKPEIPGFVLPDFRQRGGHDYRLDGKLNLKEFTKLIIESSLEHNKKLITNYPFNESLAEDAVLETPIELWKWGTKNRSGSLKVVPEDQLKAALLKHKNVRASRRGFRLFKDLYYTLPLAMSEGWFIASDKKYIRVEIAYDPRDLSEVYVKYKGQYYPAVPTPSSDKFKYVLEDCIFYDLFKQRQAKGYKEEEFKNMVKAHESLKDTVAKASQDSEAQVLNPKSLKRVKGIKANRAVEKEYQRQKVKEPEKDTKPADVISIDKKEIDNKKKTAADRLRALRNKKFNRND